MPINSDALALAAKINKKFKSDVIVVAGTIDHDLIPRVPSGSVTLDKALGGGWPCNQWVELVGEASSGKTFVALKTIAENQARNPDYTTVWVAAEQWVPGYAELVGVDSDRVLVIETNVMEEAYESVIQFADSMTVDCIVIDSLPALVPSAEDEKEMAEFTVGRGALLTNKFFRKVGASMKRSLVEQQRPVLGLMINQYRSKIGVIHGDPRTTVGGLGKDYAYFVRCEIKRDSWIHVGSGQSQQTIGQTVRVKTIKNKTAPANEVAYFDMYFADGGPVSAGQIDRASEIVAVAILSGVVERRGAYYFYADRKWQGANALLDDLRAEIDLAEDITAKVMEVLLRGTQ